MTKVDDSSSRVMIWGRDEDKARKLRDHPALREWHIEIAKDLDVLTAACNLIVTTTSSPKPLLLAHQIRPGTHITAVGTDDFGKQELDVEIFMKADRIVVDSRSQCMQFGDVSYPIRQSLVKEEELIELGEIIENSSLRRSSETEITVADLTGVAVQDLQIAAVVFDQITTLNETK